MMRVMLMIAIAGMLAPTVAMAAAPKPPLQRTVARPTMITPALQNRYENDVRMFSEWMQKLQAPQERFAQSIEKMWAAFDAHNKLAEKASEEELARLFVTLIKNLGDIKNDMVAANEELANIKPIAGNLAAAEFPPGYLSQMIADAKDDGAQVLELIDRGETQATAMSLGETELGEEFSELMADGSVAIVSSALARSRSAAAIMPKGTSNASKIGVMVSVYEAMDHLAKESRRVQKKEKASIDAIPAKAAMARAVSASKVGLTQLKKERSQMLQSATALGADLINVMKTQQARSEDWFNHMLGRASFYETVPDQIDMQDTGSKNFDELLDSLIADEAKYADLGKQMLTSMAQ